MNPRSSVREEIQAIGTVKDVLIFGVDIYTLVYIEQINNRTYCICIAQGTLPSTLYDLYGKIKKSGSMYV